MKLAFIYCRKCSTVHAPGDHKPLQSRSAEGKLNLTGKVAGNTNPVEDLPKAKADVPRSSTTRASPPSSPPHNKRDLSVSEMAEKIAHHRERRRKQAQRYRANKKLKEST